MRSSKRTDKRKLLSHLRALSSDIDFVAGAKEILARKPRPFDYDGRRNDDSQIKYEVGRLMAIRILRSSLCFLVMLVLWAIPALAQQRWWMLERDHIDFSADPSICRLVSAEGHSPSSFYEWAKTSDMSPEIIDKVDEVDVIYVYIGNKMQNSFFRTQEACQKVAQAYIDAPNAEKAKLDKYR
jgi:hypothetical protein